MNKPDIVSAIERRGIPLKRKGRYLWGQCPFHADKTPSFKVDVDKQTYKCFGCGEGGDVISFVMKMDGVDFKEAARLLSINSLRRTKPTKERLRTLAYEKWLKSTYHELADYYWALRWVKGTFGEILAFMNDDEVDGYAGFLSDIPEIEHRMDILLFGTERDKFSLFQEAMG